LTAARDRFASIGQRIIADAVTSAHTRASAASAVSSERAQPYQPKTGSIDFVEDEIRTPCGNAARATPTRASQQSC
jgi:hypothetical protein